MPALRELIDDLGATVLEVVAAPRGLDVALSGRLVLHDPIDPVEVAPGDLVVSVGVTPGGEAGRLLEAMATAGAAGVIVKQPPSGNGLAPQAAEAGIALLTVRAGSSWTQVILLVGSVLSRGSLGVPGENLAGADAGDLFAVANVVAELVDAPITIEDPASRVLAFSSRQEEADAPRAATILGRGVPEAWLARLRELGVFTRLAREREPIYIDNIGPGLIPRVAIAIRAGDQVLGSIWAAVKGPLAPERERALVDAASFVALHLLRHRLASDAESGLESELVSAVLRGGALAEEAAQRLHLRGSPCRVLALAMVGETGQQVGPELLRLKNLAALNLSSVDNRPVTGLMGGVVYAILPTREGASVQGGASMRPVVESFLKRARGLVRGRLLCAIGTLAGNTAAIPASRAAADEILRVLRTTREDLDVAELGDVRASILLLRFADACGDDPTLSASPLAALREHDERKRTAHVATCRAYLDAFGDIEVAARELDVHPNTVRYRVRQIQALTGLSLSEPTERLALELELRLIPPDKPTA